MAKRKVGSWTANLIRPVEVKNRPELLVCKWCATSRWKVFNKGYNFVLNFTSIEGFQKKLWASKVMGVLILRISGLPRTWESHDKMTFGCRPHG